MLFVARSHYAHEGDNVNPTLLSLCLALMIIRLVPLGVPYPSLYKLEGRVTCGVLLGLGLVYLLIQTGYKFGS